MKNRGTSVKNFGLSEERSDEFPKFSEWRWFLVNFVQREKEFSFVISFDPAKEITFCSKVGLNPSKLYRWNNDQIRMNFWFKWLYLRKISMRNSDKKVITQRTTEKTQRATERLIYEFSSFVTLFLCHSVSLLLCHSLPRLMKFTCRKSRNER